METTGTQAKGKKIRRKKQCKERKEKNVFLKGHQSGLIKGSSNTYLHGTMIKTGK